jgi:hypothetical protein
MSHAYRYPAEPADLAYNLQVKIRNRGVHSCAATYPVAPDLSSISRWAPVLSRVLQPRISPSCRGGLRCYHVSHGPEPRLLAELSSDAVTCSSAPDLASLSRWSPVLPRGPGLASPREELWRCHVSYGSGFCLPRGELRHCHVFLSSGPHLPAEVNSDAATWPRLRLPERRAPVLSHTPRPPAGRGQQE